jgi:hypothetical protein
MKPWIQKETKFWIQQKNERVKKQYSNLPLSAPSPLLADSVTGHILSVVTAYRITSLLKNKRQKHMSHLQGIINMVHHWGKK